MNNLSTPEQLLINSLADRETAMVAHTRELCEINSGSYNVQGVETANRALKALFEPLSENFETIPLTDIPLIEDNGKVSSFRTASMMLFSARTHAPIQILCTGHSDTVFPIDSAFQNTWIEGNHLRGPGTADMKGGLVVLSEALNAINNSPFKDSIGFTVAISPDEEIGSPASASVLMELAKKAHFGLTYEPALPDGTLAGARKGSGNFSFVVSGKSTHAGREFFAGRNALTAAARLSILLEELSDEGEGISVNIGKINGGGPVNVVPDLAVCRFNIRIKDTAQQKKLEEKIRQCIVQVEAQTECKIQLHGHFNRPPKPTNTKQQAMFNLLKECGQQLDINIEFKATGGCCEGNNLAAAGLVNIDTLGVRGAHIHSEEEYACIDSFVERAQLSALLIAKLSQQDS